MKNSPNNTLPFYIVFLKPFIFVWFLFSMVLLIPFLVVGFLLRIYDRKISNDFVTFFVSRLPWRITKIWINMSVNIKMQKKFTKSPKNKISVVILNHLTSVDTGTLYTFLGDSYKNIKNFYKSSLCYVPIMGQILILNNSCSLERNFVKDKASIENYVKFLSDNKIEAVIVIFVEGHRFTEEHSKDTVAFCKKQGMKPFRNVLCPRFKGFETVINSLQNFKIPFDVFDITQKYLGDIPTLREMIFGTKLFELEMKYDIIDSIEGGPKEFLYKRFYLKDKLLESKRIIE